MRELRRRRIFNVIPSTNSSIFVFLSFRIRSVPSTVTLSENDTTYSVIDIFLIPFRHLLLLLLICAQKWMLLMIDYIFDFESVRVLCDVCV